VVLSVVAGLFRLIGRSWNGSSGGPAKPICGRATDEQQPTNKPFRRLACHTSPAGSLAESKPPHTRLPEELWRKAVTLARRHGLHRTASALGTTEPICLTCPPTLH